MQVLIMFILISCTLSVATASRNCTFLRRPYPPVKHVSSRSTRTLYYQFSLEEFRTNDDSCLLHVAIPSGETVTFNITAEPQDRFNGDRFQEEMFVTSRRNRLKIVNVTEEFGSRVGFYSINGVEVYGAYYPASEGIDAASCKETNNSLFDIKFSIVHDDENIESPEKFKKCLQYNKKINTDDLLGCGSSCKGNITISENERSFDFTVMASDSQLPSDIDCTIDDQTYRLKVKANCPGVPAPCPCVCSHETDQRKSLY